MDTGRFNFQESLRPAVQSAVYSGIQAGAGLIGELLAEPAKTVPEPPETLFVPPPPPPVTATPPANPFAVAPTPADDDDDEVYVPLTADEIRAKAESKVEMWAALMALGVSLLNRMVAYQQVRQGDKDLIKRFDAFVAKKGHEPDYGPNHPYWAARQRWDQFEEALADADTEAELSEAQKSLLLRAVIAQLKAQNKRNKLRHAGIAETLAEVMLIKAIEPLMGLGMVMVAKMTDKALRISEK